MISSSVSNTINTNTITTSAASPNMTLHPKYPEEVKQHQYQFEMNLSTSKQLREQRLKEEGRRRR